MVVYGKNFAIRFLWIIIFGRFSSTPLPSTIQSEELANLWKSISLNEPRIVESKHLDRPWTDGSDVEVEVLLMRSRGQSERMVFGLVVLQTSDAQPLTGLVVEVRRSFHLQKENI